MVENETIKERLISFIGYLRMGQGKFEAKCGLSNGYVNNIRRSISPDKLQKIALQFPELNTGWLMTGEGEMLRPQYIEQHFSGNVSGGKNIYAPINGDKNSFSYTDIKGKTIPATGPSPIDPDKFFDELSAQRRMTEKAQQQIDRLLDIIEKMSATSPN